LRLRLEKLPPSTNDLYVKRSRSVYDLHPDVKALRDEVCAALGYKRLEWRPRGACAALILFYGPIWISKENFINTKDLDNKVKPLLDAIEKATKAPDETVWHIHCAKVLSNKLETVLYLFDLGDSVTFYER
jgi:Holliday junction resolvase RusA-like endonuclease